jgi:short-subunit dehydrogenase
MVRRRHGRVVNAASIAAFAAVPRLAALAASKVYAL